MVSTDIANLLRRIEHQRVPTETITQDVTFSKPTGIEIDEEHELIWLYARGVTAHESGLTDYAVVAYYVPKIAGMRMLEELENRRRLVKLGDRSAIAFVDAEGYRVRQSGNTAFPHDDSAAIESGHISGKLELYLATYQLELDRLNFVPAGDAIELKSDGPVKPERILEAIAGMR